MQTAKDIDLNGNSNKIDFMYFNKKGVIFSLNGKSLKSEDQCIYLGSNILLTESSANTRMSIAYTGIDRLTTFWKSDP